MCPPGRSSRWACSSAAFARCWAAIGCAVQTQAGPWRSTGLTSPSSRRASTRRGPACGRQSHSGACSGPLRARARTRRAAGRRARRGLGRGRLCCCRPDRGAGALDRRRGGAGRRRSRGRRGDGRRRLDHDPYDEAALRVLMRAYAAAGRPASALAAYARVRERLSEDLGVDPAPETEELHTLILLGDAAPGAGFDRAALLPGSRWPGRPGGRANTGTPGRGQENQSLFSSRARRVSARRRSCPPGRTGFTAKRW